MKRKQKMLLVIVVFIGLFFLISGAAHINKAHHATINQEKLQVQQQHQSEIMPLGLEKILRNADISKLESATIVPDASVQSYITSLFENGGSQTEADMQALLDVVKFWEDTNDDMQIIGRIYEQRPRAEKLTELVSNRTWIESLYNEFTGRTDILSVEEVKQYLEEGLSVEDIFAASRLSLRGDISTAQALDRIGAGESWYSVIMGEMVSVAEAEAFTADELLDVRNIAIAQNVELNIALDVIESGEVTEVQEESFEVIERGEAE